MLQSFSNSSVMYRFPVVQQVPLIWLSHLAVAATRLQILGSNVFSFPPLSSQTFSSLGWIPCVRITQWTQQIGCLRAAMTFRQVDNTQQTVCVGPEPSACRQTFSGDQESALTASSPVGQQIRCSTFVKDVRPSRTSSQSQLQNADATDNRECMVFYACWQVAQAKPKARHSRGSVSPVFRTLYVGLSLRCLPLERQRHFAVLKWLLPSVSPCPFCPAPWTGCPLLFSLVAQSIPVVLEWDYRAILAAVAPPSHCPTVHPHTPNSRLCTTLIPLPFNLAHSLLGPDPSWSLVA